MDVFCACSFMSNRDTDVSKQRREQIVEAAVAVIAEQGLQKLSLSAIEGKAGMSRGQLTYYFPAKEDILLAVFDRLLDMMHRRALASQGEPNAATPCQGLEGWERLRHFLTFFLLTPPEMPDFHALQYTFLSQIGHRDDFRQRLASLYEEWRTHMAGAFAQDMPAEPDRPRVSPRTLATFVQALLHGLAMQRVADPGSYDRQEMLRLCLHVLGNVLGRPETAIRRQGDDIPAAPTENGTRASTSPPSGEP
jgi:AcrR family transcriptional regulator